MRNILLATLVSFLFANTSNAQSERKKTPAPKDAKVYFITPKDGDKVKGPVVVRFGLTGMGVAPAGIDIPNTGHHHLIIDDRTLDLNNSVPKDEHHLHFGNGQTETTVDLKPGKHTLMLLVADHAHFPHDPPIKSEVITITVK